MTYRPHFPLVLLATGLLGCPQRLSDEFSIGRGGAGTAATANAAGSTSASGGGESNSTDGGSPMGAAGANPIGTDSGAPPTLGTKAADSDAGANAAPDPPAASRTQCNDGLLNGGEIAVDCGGPCDPCCSGASFRQPEQLLGLNLTGNHGGSTISRDGLNLIFAREDGGNEDLYSTTRQQPDGVNFAPAVALTEVNDPLAKDGTPFLSANSLTLYFFSDRAGASGRDLFQATRSDTTQPFGSVTDLGGLNTAAEEHLPNVSEDALSLLYASTIGGGPDDSDIRLATRSTTSEPFADRGLVDAINTYDNDWSPALTDSGLTLFFTSNRGLLPNDYSVYVTTRNKTQKPFRAPTKVADLDRGSSDIYLSLTADGREMFLSSSRDGSQRLYRALRNCP